MHKTAAWPLALLYSGLIVYASLYPFAEWRNQGVDAWAYLTSPVSPYWTWFDVVVNIVGYSPLGALMALAYQRSGRDQHVLAWVTVTALVLSVALETLQNYLPGRVPSRLDWALNVTGAWVGAVFAGLLERVGILSHWSRIRAQWFVTQSRGGLVLMATWPLALLFPAAVPLGLGHVMQKLQTALAAELAGTPFLEWLPVRNVPVQVMSQGAELVCVFLGALIPCLLAFCITRGSVHRLMLVALTLGVGVLATALSSALSWGPQHAWAWVNLPVLWGLLAAGVVAVLLAWARWRVSGALLLLALGVYLSLLNQAPESPYFAQTLQTWEQGRFIRFHGLAQWLGWLWPYAAVVFVLTQIGRRDAQN
jgi:VanZ family protein